MPWQAQDHIDEQVFDDNSNMHKLRHEFHVELFELLVPAVLLLALVLVFALVLVYSHRQDSHILMHVEQK